MKHSKGMTRQSVALLVVAVGMAASVQVAGGALSITDGGFDGTAPNGTDVISWFDNNTQTNTDLTITTAWWTTTSESDGPNPFPDRSVILGDGIGSTGGVLGGGGRWLYQNIGTYSGGTQYVSLDYAQPTDGNTGRAVSLRLEIFQGTFPSAADDVDLTGLTLITSLDTPLITDLDIHHFSEELDLSSANMTDPLWLRISNLPGTGTSDLGSWVCIDNVAIYSSLPPFEPITVSPLPGATGVSNPVVLTAVITDLGSSYSDAIFSLDGTVIDVDTEDADGAVTTVSSVELELPASSIHTAQVVAVATSQQRVTNEWTFTVQDPLLLVSTAPTGVGIVNPVSLEAVIATGNSELDLSTVVFYLDGVLLGSYQYDSSSGNETLVGYELNTDLDNATTHTGAVVYAGQNPASEPITNSWTFTMVGDPGYGIYIGDTNAPIPDAYDVYQFAYATVDAENVGAGDDAASYVAHDRNAQGQTFTTGGEPGYDLTSVWVKHTQGYDTYSEFDLGDTHLLRITDPSQAGTTNFVIYSETLAVITNSAGSMQGMPLTGTGYWIEYRLLNPASLNGGTQYGFDLSTDSSAYGEFYELAGVVSNAYGGGSAYTSGTANNGFGSDDIDTTWPGDHTFLVDLVPGSGTGPTVNPDIQYLFISGDSATLGWDSELGVTYKILHKSSLGTAGWLEVRTGIAGENQTTSDSVPLSGAEQEFFKVEGN